MPLLRASLLAKLGVAPADFDVLCSCVVPGNWTVADVSGLRVLSAGFPQLPAGDDLRGVRRERILYENSTPVVP